MLLGSSLGLPLLLANKTIANLDFLEAGKLKAKYLSDRHILLRFPLLSNSQMVNFQRARSLSIKMKTDIEQLQLK
jgi:hypothetical protein